MPIPTSNLLTDIARLPDYRLFGRVVAVQGLLVEVGGIQTSVSVGDRVMLTRRDQHMVPGEIVGFRDGRALLMPFGTLDGIGLGACAEVVAAAPAVYPHESWLGRVITAMAEPADSLGPLLSGPVAYPVRASPPPAHARQRVGGKLDLGIRCLNAFTTCCVGQRMGIFAASGVGKSSVMSMMAKYSSADVIVCGLIGERGREAREFIEDDLGPEGLARSVVVIATSDEPPLIRRQAAYLTMAVAEYFRDKGAEVLCLMDSVTRFAMAQREISLSAGEPPASKGYTPTVFAELPKLLERAGPGGPGQGNITGLFTVLVEGDDHNEPVSDAVRGILDGHVVLERSISERGRYPAMNILRSVSRTMPGCNTEWQNQLISRCRRIVSVYEDMSELIRLGAYKDGSNAEVDEAIALYPRIEAVLGQGKTESATLDQTYAALAEAVGFEMAADSR
ncbi:MULTISPECIES: flagellar protein export ATPase FliI [unclassified Haematospirillum]|uniref:flagellar protein export ATPase FliI n=1 Tax=unclassified Haematospirillum TaxID=2622088 RepID=UPI00143C016F|nr:MULTISPECIES: flagellar protein export ATPase FliI [unclassified Haematospirillum]NKD54475.1 flagellar protein export ATPase FliI [Haematospirillum sp. H4890]NKD74518.1 flagellar protein export ATPase FliI [Haematospirillum sp. H4485]NKD86809.1 flagellar protein export ATPase FliI [Haematospirillum sp. 15-248]